MTHHTSNWIFDGVRMRWFGGGGDPINICLGACRLRLLVVMCYDEGIDGGGEVEAVDEISAQAVEARDAIRRLWGRENARELDHREYSIRRVIDDLGVIQSLRRAALQGVHGGVR